MQNKIAILTTGHPPFDERIYWKFGISLAWEGSEVHIICSTEDISTKKNGISIRGFSGGNITKKEKINHLLDELTAISPDIIICCEPLAILPAYRFRKKYNKNCKIISDITEWYPENVTSKMRGIKKFAAYIFLFISNIILTNLADALIIGEVTKMERYNFIAPFKKKIIIGYYPVLSLFKYSPPQFDGRNLALCYAGLINFQRGIRTLVDIAKILSLKHKDINITIKLIGRFQSESEEKEFDKLVDQTQGITVEKKGWTEYSNISNLLTGADICFDLREKNFIYNNSLPIKIFEYMASGKPFIFTDIIPIRKELGDIDYGFLVDPSDTEELIRKIEQFISNPGLLKQSSEKAREVIENGKNWESESEKLISFIQELCNPE